MDEYSCGIALAMYFSKTALIYRDRITEYRTKLGMSDSLALVADDLDRIRKRKSVLSTYKGGDIG